MLQEQAMQPSKCFAQHKRDRAKRRRKAKLRVCLEKKGSEKAPIYIKSCEGGVRFSLALRSARG